MSKVRFAVLVVLAVGFLMGLASTGLAEETKGKIKAVLADDKTFTLTDNAGKDHTMELAVNAKVRINARDAKLADLRAGDEVVVTWEERNGRKQVSLITCKKE